MNALSDVLMRQAEAGAGAEAFLDLEKALPKLLAASDDPHFKVSLAALAAIQVCINTAPHVIETQLDKLMPLLFLKLCAAKQQVRSAAEGALQACALRLGADSLLPALVRSLDAMKQPAARVSVMEFCVLFLGPGKVAGMPNTTGPLRQWVSKNIPLLLDKNPNVRQMAARALATMFSIDPSSVQACVAHASPQEVHAVQRSLHIEQARAAAEEQQEEAAAAMGGMGAEHIQHWAQRGHWGTQGGSMSVSSSMDLSANGIEAGSLAGVTAGMADMGIRSESSHNGGAQVLQVTHHPAAVGSGQIPQAPDVMYIQQQQPEQRYISGLPISADSSPGAVEGSGTVGTTVRDVLGRPMPAGYSSMTPATAVATPAAPTLHTVGHVGSTYAYGVPASAVEAQQLHTTPFPPAPTAGTSYSSGVAAQPFAADTPTAAMMPATASVAQPSDPVVVSSAAAEAAAAAAAGDAGSQARHLTVLVHRLQSRPSEDVLAELAACAGTLSQQAWQANFSKVLMAAISATQHTQDNIRELAFMLVLALARHHGPMFEPVLDVVVQPLLQGCADESREVLMAAQSALEELMSVMPPLHCVDILAHKLPSEAATASGTAVDGEVLCATIRCLQMVCRQMTSSELLSVAPSQLLPGIFAAFQHPRPDVRKAVTFCLVDMWLAAGEGLTPYLSSLATSQLKLLTIYYNRTLAQRQQEMAAAVEQQ
eukprot:GHUV01014010.1.p1 GENE.GHUV01014010.1~~GHUV01014010.1.p1  ORF type:complete len:768 (+),score=287.98 GHUV01014010.1:178-2304(+)